MQIRVTSKGGLAGFRVPSKKSKVRPRLRRALSKVWREGVVVFAETVVKRVPQDTGMSAASVFALVRRVRASQIPRVAGLVKPRRGPQKGYTTINRQYIKGGTRGPATGDRLGENAFTISFGSAKRLFFTFTFKHVVWQHFLADIGGANFKSPARSIEAGARAMNLFVRRVWISEADRAIKSALNG